VRLIDYTPTLDIRNSGALPGGVGAKYLECVEGVDGALVAKRWRRKIPSTYDVIVVMPSAASGR
jgi:hypothetical protein